MHEPDEKKSDVVFVLVHHYGGSGRTLRRHVNLVNHFGFTAVTFDLEGAHNQKVFLPPVSKRWQWGLRYMWSDRIEEILKLVEGDKIILTLSNPSYSVLEAVYRIQGKNIKGIICDGGPFFDIFKCYWNLFTHAFKYPLPLRILQLFLGGLYWNPLCYKAQAKRNIKQFGKNVPLLSIRAEQDNLVPVDSIDKCLQTYPQENLTQVLLKNCGHLMGVKLEKEVYYREVGKFLEQHSLISPQSH